MLYALLAWAGISGYLAFMSRNMLLRLSAAIPWLALWNYFANNYPDETWTTFAILGCIAMAIAIPFSLFERLIDYRRVSERRQTVYDKPVEGALGAAEGEQATGFFRRLASRINMEERPSRKRQIGETPEEYRDRVRRVLRRRM